MAFTTSVYPAKVAVDALLKAHTWPGDAPAIVWGQPSDSDKASFDLIYQGHPAPSDQFLTLGAGRATESYDLTVVIDVYRYGDDEQAVEALAYSHLNEVIRALTADKTLSGAVNTIQGFRYTVASEPPAASQWRTQIIVGIAVVQYSSIP